MTLVYQTACVPQRDAGDKVDHTASILSTSASNNTRSSNKSNRARPHQPNSKDTKAGMTKVDEHDSPRQKRRPTTQEIEAKA